MSVEFLMSCLKSIYFSVLFNSELNMIWTCCVRNVFNCQWLQGNGFINMDQVSISHIKSEWISEVCTSSLTVSDGGIDCMTGTKRSFRLYPISHHHSTSKIMSQALRCLSFIDWFIDHFQFCSSYIFWAVVVIEMDSDCHGYTMVLTRVFYVLSGCGVVLRVSSRQQRTLQETFVLIVAFSLSLLRWRGSR